MAFTKLNVFKLLNLKKNLYFLNVLLTLFSICLIALNNVISAIIILIIIIFNSSILYIINNKSEKDLFWLAIHDELTGLLNRRYFDQQIELEWYRAMRTNSDLGLIIIDIDYFKKYNDILGHQAGDICIKTIAITINKIVNRASDCIARYGGDEFVMLLPNTDNKGLEYISRKIQTELSNLNFKHPHAVAYNKVTVSIGISSAIPTKNLSSEIMIEKADLALYQAKHAGRNCYKINIIE